VIRATAAVFPLEVFVDGKPLPMGGIADVATHAAYRRRGYVGELMRATLDGMRERGVHLSMLYPFYRRYGWELATEAISYRREPTDLPIRSGNKRVRAYQNEDLQPMMALLEGESSRHPLCVRRGEAHWRTAGTGEHGGGCLRGGRAGGGLLYEQGEDRNMPRTLTVLELVADTPAAREALHSFMSLFDPLMFEVRYSTPRGEPLHPFLPSSYV
jgi:predicted acetyltransferase